MPSREKPVKNAKTVLKFICLGLSIHIYINNMWKTEDVDSVMRNGLAKKIAAVLVGIIMVLCGLGVGGFTSGAVTGAKYTVTIAAADGVSGYSVTVEQLNGSDQPIVASVSYNTVQTGTEVNIDSNASKLRITVQKGNGEVVTASTNIAGIDLAAFGQFNGNAQTVNLADSQVVNISLTLQTAGSGGDPGQGGGNTESTVIHTTNLTDNGRPAIEISVNADEPNLDNEQALTAQGTTVSYNWNSGETVRIWFHCLFIYVPTSITINETQVLTAAPSNQELLNHYSEQMYHFYYDVPQAETYTISTTAVAGNASNTPIGNFLWNYDHPESDDYVSHARLEVVSVTYNGETISVADSPTTNYGGAKEWNNDTTDEHGDHIGSATLPAGAIVTMRLIPEYGYQLVNFGVNDGNFEAQETPCVYTFVVAPGNFHLYADFEPVENEVDADSTNVVSGGSVVLNGAESSMEAGTARLDVSDANLEPAQISGFEGAAAGYRVTNYLDISLFNTIYQGSETESWDTQVHNLDNSATITLQLAAGVDGNEVVIVHEVSPGVYETIPTVYDPVARTITFTTRGFSNYAIASRTVETTDNSNSSEGLPTRAPKTGYPEFPAMAVISALFGAVLVSYGIKKGRITG